MSAPPTHRKAPSGTQSVRRAIALLKAFSGEKHEMELADLSRAVGLTRTTTHRLLGALESEGLVTKNPDSHAYRLGPAAITLGSRALRTNDLRATVRPFLQKLAEQTRETATLEVYSDGRMLILDEVLGAHLVGTSPSVGTAWAVHATSTGKAFLASFPGEDWKKLVETPLRAFTLHTITDSRRFEREIERVRIEGYATAVEELEEGYVAVGASVTGALGEAVGSISIGGPTLRLTPSRLPHFGEAIKEEARNISAKLGYEI